ncbi:MAG: hypothetical protein IBX68_02780 [Dehalococcoidia bacterium]|nr:hypothetical protein [Dehalococcoidia bacterium]
MSSKRGWFSRALVVLVAAAVLAGFLAAGPVAQAAPSVRLSPASGPIGTQVSISISGMVPGSVIAAGDLTFGGKPWNTSAIPVDSSGSMCCITLTVPAASPGTQWVVAKAGGVTAFAGFSITRPTLSISPTSGYKGETVWVTGGNWPLRTPGAVTITFNGAPIKPVTPNAAGGFSIDITVPATATATSTIGATDVLGNAALNRNFTLKPAELVISPTSAKPGTAVSVTGKGFSPLSPVEEVQVGETRMPIPGLITDSTGAFSTSFTVPAVSASAVLVSATVAGFSRTTYLIIVQSPVWIPLQGSPSYPIEDCLAPIMEKLVRVWSYHAGEWQMFDPKDRLGSRLTGMVDGRAYWVLVSEDCHLIFRPLKAGWNNIGW